MRFSRNMLSLHRKNSLLGRKTNFMTRSFGLMISILFVSFAICSIWNFTNVNPPSFTESNVGIDEDVQLLKAGTTSYAEDRIKMNTGANGGKYNSVASDGASDGNNGGVISIEELESRLEEVSSADDVNTDPPPAVVWLMSYPNSGTSFTMEMTQRNSKTTAATNYHSKA